MPSASLTRWRDDRMRRLDEVGAQCDELLSGPLPQPLLPEEALRGYVVVLCGHFQGFCRDLYTECAQLCVGALARTGASELMLQRHLLAELRLDVGNPTVESIRKDYERFDFVLNFGPANAAHLTHLNHLNKWRNSASLTRRCCRRVPGSL